jgi:hypothetical protein
MEGSMRKYLLVLIAVALLVAPSFATVYRITTVNRYVGLAADSKPTGVPVGSTFWAYDTNIEYVTYDGTNWQIMHVHSLQEGTTFDLNQAASTYDLYTATGGTLFVQQVTFTLPASPDVTDDATITSISIQTDTAVPITILSAAAGAKANLIAGTTFTYSTPFYLPTGKKIQITINGGAADATTTCTANARYSSSNPAAYLAP